jgi:hypothetical protein
MDMTVGGRPHMINEVLPWKDEVEPMIEVLRCCNSPPGTLKKRYEGCLIRLLGEMTNSQTHARADSLDESATLLPCLLLLVERELPTLFLRERVDLCRSEVWMVVARGDSGALTGVHDCGGRNEK